MLKAEAWPYPVFAGVECVPLKAALIAAFQVTAQSGRAAHLDGGHDASLPRRH